jgi:hypothetical protein
MAPGIRIADMHTLPKDIYPHLEIVMRSTRYSDVWETGGNGYLPLPSVLEPRKNER